MHNKKSVCEKCLKDKYPNEYKKLSDDGSILLSNKITCNECNERVEENYLVDKE